MDEQLKWKQFVDEDIWQTGMTQPSDKAPSKSRGISTSPHVICGQSKQHSRIDLGHKGHSLTTDVGLPRPCGFSSDCAMYPVMTAVRSVTSRHAPITRLYAPIHDPGPPVNVSGKINLGGVN